MSEILRRVQTLVLAGDWLASEHGYGELSADDIVATVVVDGIAEAVAVEEYGDRHRGPSVLTLQRDQDGRPINVVWAIPAGQRRPAVLVTAYRPDPARWDADLKVRRPK
ncbi:DUF4258 domain-containing protein [Rhodoplanes sp. SY1]|uniref:DUF4258 domain-containing protein n=1 Tax=Rhodoplanes sp. SY1 TaxID=3166646 RepID=UPI0038B5A9AA